MSACPACAAALLDPYTIHVQAGCLGCEVRRVSLAPHFSRLAFYEQIRDPQEREAFASAVVLEYRRRKAWMLARPAANDGPGPARA